jgi:hypothetical protein
MSNGKLKTGACGGRSRGRRWIRYPAQDRTVVQVYDAVTETMARSGGVGYIDHVRGDKTRSSRHLKQVHTHAQLKGERFWWNDGLDLSTTNKIVLWQRD